jgi:hypothetical protein
VSVEAFTWALNVPIGGNAKVILLGLANHAHPDGSEAYPSLETLSKYAHCDRSTARRNVRKLVEEGWASEDGYGPKGQTKYRLAIGGKMPRGANRDGVAFDTPHGVAPVPPEPSLGTVQGSSLSKQGEGEKKTASNPSLIDENVKRDATRGRAREGGLKVRGRKVPQAVAAASTLALDGWNTRTGQTLRPLKGSGKPSEALSRIVGAMTDFPEVVELWPRMMDAALSAPWWTDEQPGTGVVFGPNVVERYIQQAQAPIPAGGRSRLRIVGGREVVDWDAVANDLEARGM